MLAAEMKLTEQNIQNRILEVQTGVETIDLEGKIQTSLDRLQSKMKQQTDLTVVELTE